MLVTETTGIKLLPKIIVLNPKDGDVTLAYERDFTETNQ